MQRRVMNKNAVITIGEATLYTGDCRKVMQELPADSIDSCITDAPYHLQTIVKRFSKASIDADTYTSMNARNSATPYARLSRGFMSKSWDGGDVAFDPDTWREVYRVLKPGAFMAVFGGSRTYHRVACAIEDAGFELRDTIMWLYAASMPKSLNIAKAIDKQFGAIGSNGVVTSVSGVRRGSKQQQIHGNPRKDSRQWSDAMSGGFDTDKVNRAYVPATPEAAQWNGFGTGLRPSHEPIIICRKPFPGTVTDNVLKYGTGALNIDGCRTPTTKIDGSNLKQTMMLNKRKDKNGQVWGFNKDLSSMHPTLNDMGRWPANVCHDGSDEVMEAFELYGVSPPSQQRWAGLRHSGRHGGIADLGPNLKEGTDGMRGHDDQGGSASRFFPLCPWSDNDMRFYFSGKATAYDRAGSQHPTVKPLALMLWLTKLITPPGGTLIDPFMGSGPTLEAARQNAFKAIGIDSDPVSVADTAKRLDMMFKGLFQGHQRQ